jgi:hypothetical protein
MMRAQDDIEDADIVFLRDSISRDDISLFFRARIRELAL